MMPVGEAQFLAVVWQEGDGAEVQWVTPKERAMMAAAEALKVGVEYGTEQFESGEQQQPDGAAEGGAEGGGVGCGCGAGGAAEHGDGDGDGGEQGAGGAGGAA